MREEIGDMVESAQPCHRISPAQPHLYNQGLDSTLQVNPTKMLSSWKITERPSPPRSQELPRSAPITVWEWTAGRSGGSRYRTQYLSCAMSSAGVDPHTWPQFVGHRLWSLT